jgi:hypothetical protein
MKKKDTERKERKGKKVVKSEVEDGKRGIDNKSGSRIKGVEEEDR